MYECPFFSLQLHSRNKGLGVFSFSRGLQNAEQWTGWSNACRKIPTAMLMMDRSLVLQANVQVFKILKVLESQQSLPSAQAGETNRRVRVRFHQCHWWNGIRSHQYFPLTCFLSPFSEKKKKKKKKVTMPCRVRQLTRDVTNIIVFVESRRRYVSKAHCAPSRLAPHIM